MTAPALSTVHEILRRHGRIVPPAGAPRRTQRFEKPAPNLLWQMDFKGWVQLADGSALPSADHGGRSFALCAVSRSLRRRARQHGARAGWRRPSAATACRRPSSSTMARLGRFLGRALDPARRVAAQARRRGSAQPALSSAEPRQERALPPHAQGRGLRAQALPRSRRGAARLRSTGATVYNFERPHEALDQEVPASRYRPSPRAMPDRLPEVEYDEDEIVRTVPTTKALRQLQGPPLEGAAGLPRRTRRHPAA